MRFRLLNKIYANFFGYFWLECPLCSQFFGGHEWKDENTLWRKPDQGVGVCKDCGETARIKSAKIRGVYYGQT